MAKPDTTFTATRFRERFGHDPAVLAMAPGRVNLIGEHTDYNQGFVLPVAIDYYTIAAVSLRTDSLLQVIAEDLASGPVLIDLAAPMQSDKEHPWSNYVRGVVSELQRLGHKLRGVNVLLSGNIPVGAGLSSSASLELALVKAFAELFEFEIKATDAALVGQAAENNFVGCACGIMDQLISASGQEQHAVLIDCESLALRAVPFPDDWQLLIVHSGVKRGLVESQYNQRRQQCEQAAAYFGADSLRQVSQAQLETATDALDPLVYRRARHVLTENARTLAACEAILAADLPRLSHLMADSHASMRDDFEITTPAIDTLVSIIAGAGGSRVGVRMTGGGFGGCVVAVAPVNMIDSLIQAVEKEYQAATGCVPMMIPALASAGAFAGMDAGSAEVSLYNRGFY